jgi:hypothetical protein
MGGSILELSSRGPAMISATVNAKETRRKALEISQSFKMYLYHPPLSISSDSLNTCTISSDDPPQSPANPSVY